MRFSSSSSSGGLSLGTTLILTAVARSTTSAKAEYSAAPETVFELDAESPSCRLNKVAWTFNGKSEGTEISFGVRKPS